MVTTEPVTKSDDFWMRRKVARDLDKSLIKAGIDPTVIVQEPQVEATEHDRYARERLFHRDQDPLVRVPGE